jgi:hypothetical protein
VRVSEYTDSESVQTSRSSQASTSTWPGQLDGLDLEHDRLRQVDPLAGAQRDRGAALAVEDDPAPQREHVQLVTAQG